MTRTTGFLTSIAIGLASTAVLATSAAAVPITPQDGYYSYYEFDCASPCGGSYGTWEVDLQVDEGGRVARFSHIGAKCNNKLAPGYTWSGDGKSRPIEGSTVSVAKSVRIKRKTYTITTRLKWTATDRAHGWVEVDGPRCNARRARFTVDAG